MANWTGNAYVDALLLGEKWNTNNLTYFLKGGSATWNAIETAAMQAALQSWADVANISFTQVLLESAANIVEDQFNDSPGSLGVHQVHNDYTTVTIQQRGSQLNGSYNFSGFGWDENDANGGLQVGGLGYLTIVHEIGHALGLDHSHDDGAGNVNFFPGASSSSDLGNNNLNQDVFSVMSYVHGDEGKNIDGGAGADNYGFVSGPMAFDIATIQYLYGANTSKNTGNNTYIMPDANSAGTYFSAIWDAGGTDEIVYQGSANATIDLRSATLADEVGGGGFVSSATNITGGFTIAGDFTNALADVNGEVGVIIENATGGSGDDLITGNNVANVINGNAGKDIIAANGGNDTVNGGEGLDHLSGNDGNDTIVGGYDNDEIYGGAGADIIYGDNLDGSGRTGGASGISLGSGQITKNKTDTNGSVANAINISNSFSLASDSDISNATTIPHVSITGEANGTQIDYYKVVINNAGSVITLDVDYTDAHGNPTGFDSYIRLINADGSLVSALSFDDDSPITDGAGGSINSLDSFLTYTFANAGTYYIQMGRFGSSGITNLLVDATYELQISVNGELTTNNDTISAGADNDIIHASVGNDGINGGTGIDTYDFSHDTQGAVIDLSNLITTAVGAGIGTDALLGIENVTGGSGDDTITGDVNINQLLGGAGNDIFYSNAGGGGNDVFNGGEGGETTGDTVSYVTDTAGIIVNLEVGTATGTSEGNDTLINIENVTGGSGNDSLTGDEYANTITGGNGADDLNPLGGADKIIGGDGFDTVYYFSSQSAIAINLTSGTGSGGDAQGDTYSGIERIFSSAYNDSLTGDASANSFFGGAGSDDLNPLGGADTINGGDGADTVYYISSPGAVYVNLTTGVGQGADAQGDILTSIEWLHGSQYGDNLIGSGAEINAFYGHGGNDEIAGFGGTDTFIGGAGNDTFYIHNLGDEDLISDFEGVGAAIGDRINVQDFGFSNFAELQSVMADILTDLVKIQFDGDDVLWVRGDGVSVSTLVESDFLL